MSGLIVITVDIPNAEELREMFATFGYAAELRRYWDAILFGDPRAVLLSMHSSGLPADERAAGLREKGYRGVLFVLGRSSPDLEVRQRLAQHQAWFMPAISGPGEVLFRVRQLLV